MANYLGLFKSAISMIIKSVKSGDWTAGVYLKDKKAKEKEWSNKEWVVERYAKDLSAKSS